MEGIGQRGGGVRGAAGVCPYTVQLKKRKMAAGGIAVRLEGGGGRARPGRTKASSN